MPSGRSPVPFMPPRRKRRRQVSCMCSGSGCRLLPSSHCSRTLWRHQRPPHPRLHERPFPERSWTRSRGCTSVTLYPLVRGHVLFPRDSHTFLWTWITTFVFRIIFISHVVHSFVHACAGYYFDGSSFVDSRGRRDRYHPNMDQYIKEYYADKS